MRSFLVHFRECAVTYVCTSVLVAGFLNIKTNFNQLVIAISNYREFHLFILLYEFQLYILHVDRYFRQKVNYRHWGPHIQYLGLEQFWFDLDNFWSQGCIL